MVTINVGGVPEHFNLPWHLCLEEGLFEAAGIHVKWKDFPGGTGAMTRELRHNGLDLALVLTEGMIADIFLGNRSKIIGFYTKTPLIWGVHSTAYNRFEVVKPHKDIQFKVVGNLNGARQSLADKFSNLFLWEKFTTKPFVDSGELKRLTNHKTPWPCFVFSATDAALAEKKASILKVMEIVLQRAQVLKQDPKATSLIANRYGLKEKDVKVWLQDTDWESKRNVNLPVINNCIDILKDLNIIKTDLEIDNIIAS